MAYFAELDADNNVIRVLSVRNEDITDQNGNEQEALGIAWLQNLFGGTWVKTSYNTHSNVHYNPSTGEPDGGTPLRGNYAGIGYIYDKTNDVFYLPRPLDRNNIQCDSWTISVETNWIWSSPIPKPTIAKLNINYFWDESTRTWIEYTWDKTTATWVLVTT